MAATDINLLDVGDYDDPAWMEANRLLEARQFAAVLELAAKLGPAARPPTLNIAAVAATLAGTRPLAESCFRRAIAADPDFAQSYNNLAVFLRVDRRIPEAEQVLRAGLAAAPDEPLMRMSLANLLWLQERYPEAEATLREVVRRWPDHAEARFRLGAVLLLMGRYEEGWAYYEARYDPTRKGGPDPIAFGCPQWLGEPLEGRSILVWYEQGHGDEIHFCRYVPMLKAAGAAKVTVVCKPALAPLLASLDGIDRLVPAEGVHEIETHDYWTYLLSLPHRMGTRLETIPAKVPYLRPPPERRARWAERLPQDGVRVGLVWKGNPELANDANRSLPGLATLRPLWDVPGVTFVSLQKGAGEEEAAAPPEGQPLLDLGRQIQDFGDSAALIAALDLVISVDTAPAHLAGALGKPCFCLLPAEGLDFRWLLRRSDSPWYPTMTLFRRPLGARWDVVIPKVAAALDRFARSPALAAAS